MASDVNHNFPRTKVFISEHLTPDNKRILYQLKDACKELDIEGKFFVGSLMVTKV